MERMKRTLLLSAIAAAQLAGAAPVLPGTTHSSILELPLWLSW